MHTKGDWRLQKCGVVSYRIITNNKHTMNLDGPWYPSQEQIDEFHANARLIVKAPVLLKRLEEAREAIASLDDHALGMTFDPRAGYQWAIKAELLSNIDEAINEARGE